MLSTTWFDRGREPQCAPDPAYPAGKDLDASLGSTRTCSTALPYPAKRCGLYVVECDVCGLRVGITTAGRPDDPRSVKLACVLPRNHRKGREVTNTPYDALLTVLAETVRAAPAAERQRLARTISAFAETYGGTYSGSYGWNQFCLSNPALAALLAAITGRAPKGGR